jgi:D-glycero-alpha-D-manno-heptose-7-phosphate kinase
MSKLIRARAPLRLGLAGGGTDVSPYCDEFGGSVLNATLDKYAYAIIETDCAQGLAFVAADRGTQWAGPITPSVVPDGPEALHKAVYNRIVREFNAGAPLSLTLTTYCDAPPGSGLGSSSTLVVAMIKAFQELLRLPLGEYEIAQLAFDIERNELGLSGGRQDQYAATFGGFNYMEFYGGGRVIVNPLRIKNWIISELEASLVLYFTGISRESAQIIDQQQRNVKDRNEQAIQAMHEVKREAVAMKEALLKGDFDALAESLRQSWASKKRMAASVSNSTIDAVLDTAMGAGARAAKVSGAGGGGFMMLLVDPVRRMDVLRALKGCGGQAMDCQFTKHGTQGWMIR